MLINVIQIDDHMELGSYQRPISFHGVELSDDGQVRSVNEILTKDSYNLKKQSEKPIFGLGSEEIIRKLHQADGTLIVSPISRDTTKRSQVLKYNSKLGNRNENLLYNLEDFYRSLCLNPKKTFLSFLINPDIQVDEVDKLDIRASRGVRPVAKLRQEADQLISTAEEFEAVHRTKPKNKPNYPDIEYRKIPCTPKIVEDDETQSIVTKQILELLQAVAKKLEAQKTS